MSPPGRIQVALSKLADGGARLIGRRGAIDPATAAMGQLYWYAQGERALHELGFRPRPADDTLGDTVHSLTRHG